ncbi:MAG: MCP four helix bundle domain-containing protein, partial [Desulfamplus sp.]|nr:MCP four helix bundle domain-containing protein [Desulfamplus sp.]
MNKLTIGVKLGLSFAVIILLMLVSGITDNMTMNQIAENTVKLYRHPYTVGTAILRIDGNILRIHHAMTDVMLSKNSDDIKKTTESMDLYEKKID